MQYAHLRRYLDMSSDYFRRKETEPECERIFDFSSLEQGKKQTRFVESGDFDI